MQQQGSECRHTSNPHGLDQLVGTIFAFGEHGGLLCRRMVDLYVNALAVRRTSLCNDVRCFEG